MSRAFCPRQGDSMGARLSSDTEIAEFPEGRASPIKVSSGG